MEGSNEFSAQGFVDLHRRLGTAQVHYGPVWDATLQEAADALDKTIVAVLVCHGMGEQVRYETISSVAEAILERARIDVGDDNVSAPEVALACEDQNYLARAEIKWRNSDEDGRVLHQHEVHIYEAYWAPVTEGQVTYWETVKFLLGAAWNGLKFSHPFGAHSFKRWMFGEPKSLNISGKTFYGPLAVLFVLVAQVAIIGFVSLELAQHYKDVIAQPLPLVQGGEWTSDLLGMLKKMMQWLSPFLPGVMVVLDRSQPMLHRIGEIFKLIGWLLLIAEAFLVRYFLIEYVGDVAAYISPLQGQQV